MKKSKSPSTGSEQAVFSPKSPFSGFSRFGNRPNRFGGQKFNPKGIVVRPTFVTQHKGGGGK